MSCFRQNTGNPDLPDFRPVFNSRHWNSEKSVRLNFSVHLREYTQSPSEGWEQALGKSEQGTQQHVCGYLIRLNVNWSETVFLLLSFGRPHKFWYHSGVQTKYLKPLKFFMVERQFSKPAVRKSWILAEGSPAGVFLSVGECLKCHIAHQEMEHCSEGASLCWSELRRAVEQVCSTCRGPGRAETLICSPFKRCTAELSVHQPTQLDLLHAGGGCRSLLLWLE